MKYLKSALELLTSWKGWTSVAGLVALLLLSPYVRGFRLFLEAVGVYAFFDIYGARIWSALTGPYAVFLFGVLSCLCWFWNARSIAKKAEMRTAEQQRAIQAARDGFSQIVERNNEIFSNAFSSLRLHQYIKDIDREMKTIDERFDVAVEKARALNRHDPKYKVRLKDLISAIKDVSFGMSRIVFPGHEQIFAFGEATTTHVDETLAKGIDFADDDDRMQFQRLWRQAEIAEERREHLRAILESQLRIRQNCVPAQWRLPEDFFAGLGEPQHRGPSTGDPRHERRQRLVAAHGQVN